MWITQDKYGNSMKWHIAKEGSIEEREVEEGWGDRKKKVKKPFGIVDCPSTGHTDQPFQAKIKETINIFQANVCSYCRRRKLKEHSLLEIEQHLLKLRNL